MKTIHRAIESRIQNISLRRRVAVLEETGPAIVVADACSITSTVPYVRLEHGHKEYTGRRRRLRFGQGASTSLIMARLRESPRELPENAHTTTVTDDRGVERPIAVFDRANRTIHVLIETDRAVAIDEAAPGDAARQVAETLVDGSLAALLIAEGAPRVGERVPELVRDLLTRRIRGRRPRFEREIRFLQRAGERHQLPPPLVRRLNLLEEALRGDKKRTVDPAVAQDETRRLTQLVASRACASIRLAPDQIRGLLNPRTLDDTLGHGGLMFALQPAPAPGGPRLRMWRAGEPEQGSSRTMCLGRAGTVLSQLENGRDTFGMVDTILNFVETNAVGAVPLAAPTALRRFSAALEHLF